MYNENQAKSAWFNKGFADAQKTNERQAQNAFHPKAPSGRGLREAVEENAIHDLQTAPHPPLHTLNGGEPPCLPPRGRWLAEQDGEGDPRHTAGRRGADPYHVILHP